jgi:threonine dehydratase
MTTINDFRLVRARIQPHVRVTPLVPSELSNTFLKLENLQVTHSFKARGAFARVIELVGAKDTRRLLTVSAGNHGQAIALAAATFHIPCTVVVPANAPKAKIEAIRSYGADLRIEGSNYDEAEEWTLRTAANSRDQIFISPYNDPTVILGQGTLGFEILEQLPNVASIIVPIGGGGLAAGIGTLIKQFRPSVKVFGVQTEASAPIYHGLRSGRLNRVPDLPSIADGIAGNIDLNAITFPLIQQYLDSVVLVSEEQIKSAMEHLLMREKLVTEGSAAAAFAAVLYGRVKAPEPIAVLITGGNLDMRYE